MNALSASEPMLVIGALLFGTLCLGPVLALILFSQWAATLTSLQRIPRMEYKINLISQHLDLENPGPSDEVRSELWKGNKINAIKIYREQTGVGLKEAKDVIDALQRGDIATLERSNGTA